METLNESLKTAGWTDELIHHFMQPEYVIVDSVVSSNWVVEDLIEQMDVLDIPQKYDAITFISK